MSQKTNLASLGIEASCVFCIVEHPAPTLNGRTKNPKRRKTFGIFIYGVVTKVRHNYSAAGASSSAGATTSTGASTATGASTGAFSGTTLTATLISTSLWK